MSALFILLSALLGLTNPPAIDDAECVEPPVLDVQPGDDYSRGVWTHTNGVVFALQPHEDSCLIVPVDAG